MSTTAGGRRIVSVLIADVAGSTAIAERLGPERSKFLFDDVVRLMREEIERFGGTVAQLTGDGVLALFGAPVAHEDDSERAVRAALAIHEATGTYGREVEKAYGVELSARIAVNSGPVVVPESDEPPERLYNALGDTVNTAARLQALGDLVVGPDTARQLEDRFDLEELGEVELKGKAAPVAAFRVAGERAVPIEQALSPLVGREAELALLTDVFEGLLEGRGAIVAIAGEPGIGKSRLKSEAWQHFHDRIAFLEGYAASYAEEIPYWPLRALLRDWLGVGISDPEARLRLELRARLAGTLGDESEDVSPFLASVLALPLERQAAERLRDLSRDSVQQQTFDAVRRLACALAAERPLCLVLEDLQWADEATLALLEDLLTVTEEEAISFFLSYRTEEEHRGWDLVERARRRFRHRFVEIELAPLPPEASRELAVAAARAELPEAVTALLAERSGGNPFFLEEALRDLIERGALRQRNGGLELENSDDLRMPTAVEEALQARLDRLDPPTREVIGVASVVGRSFGTPLLERLVAGEDLRPALSELQRLDLIVEERRRPTPEYRFRHGLVQEAAYGRLLEARRRELHHAVGEALETLHRDAPEEVYGLLARHFSAAGDSAQAVEYLLKAGDAARSIYANEEAVELYQRALVFMRRIGEEPRSRETLLKIALTHHLAFDFERARTAYAQAFALPEPEPSRLEPSDRITVGSWSLDSVVPGHAYIEHSSDLCRHLFRGLVGIGPNLEIIPELAESFTVSADGTAYRFRIRPAASWSDGAPVTAGDFAFTWRRMRDEKVRAVHLLDDIASAEALDARTLEVRLDEPRNYFLHLLAHPSLFAWPRHVYEQRGPKWHETAVVGNGPFVLTELDETKLRLMASPTWFGSRGNVLEVEMDMGETSPELLSRWENGQYDVIPFVESVEGSGTHEQSSPGMSTIFLLFRSDRPPLDDARVRRALACAIDRQRFAERSGYIGDSTGTGGLIPPTLPGHSHRVAPTYDPGLARSLLAEAGYPGGEGFPELVVGHGNWLRADDLADQFAEIGLRVNVVELAPAAHANFVEHDVDALAWGWAADFPDPAAMIDPLLKQFPQDIYREEQLTELLDRARSLRDQHERLALYREFERLWIGEHVAVVPLHYRRRALHVRPWVDGLWINAIVTSTLAEAVVHRDAVQRQPA